MNRIEQHRQSLDRRILGKQVLGRTYAQRSRQNLDLAIGAGFVKPGERALEIGTGDGLMLGLLAEQGIAASGVCKSRSDYEACRQEGYDIHFADMSELPFEDHEFDFIYSRNAFDHSLMPTITLCEFRRVLKPHKMMFIEFEWYSAEDLRKHKEVRRLRPTYKAGGSYNKHRHWSAMTYDQMCWLLRRLDLKLADSFFADESQAFIIENTPCRDPEDDDLDQWGRYRREPNSKSEARRSFLRNLWRARAK